MRAAIVDRDVLALGGAVSGQSIALAASALPGDARIAGFQQWLDRALLEVVLEADAAYLDPMIAVAYARGVSRAQRLTRSRARPPAAADQIAAIQQLVLAEMQGVVEVVSQALVRLAARAVIDGGVTRRDLFAQMADRVQKIGVHRSELAVTYHVVKAHATGTLDQFEAAEVRAVGVLPETVLPARRSSRDSLTGDAPPLRRLGGPGSRISRTVPPSRSTVARIAAAQRRVERLRRVDIATAGDERVCEICEGLESDGPYTINEARSLIPAHANCRCAFVPAIS